MASIQLCHSLLIEFHGATDRRVSVRRGARVFRRVGARACSGGFQAEELKAGGKGWKTRKRQQRALEKLSIVLARENGAMIARATSWQQAVATRP